MIFTSKIRDAGNSLVITIPVEIVEKFKLKAEQIREFAIVEED